MEFKMYEKLKEAWETTTQSCNRFKKAIEAIKWENTFQADGETYFIKGGLTLTVENLNPFKEQWHPEVMFSDGTIITF